MKRTPCPTRKRLALRWTLRAAVTLVVLNVLFHTCFLFPRQAVHMQLERFGVSELTERLLTLPLPERSLTARAQLLSAPHAAALVTTRLSPVGWTAAGGGALDLSAGAPQPIYVGECQLRQKTNDPQAEPVEFIQLFYGVVTDPAVDSLELLVSSFGEDARSEALHTAAVLKEEELLSLDGRRFFLVKHLRPPFAEREYAGDSLLRAYAADGTLLYETGMALTSSGG